MSKTTFFNLCALAICVIALFGLNSYILSATRGCYNIFDVMAM